MSKPFLCLSGFAVALGIREMIRDDPSSDVCAQMDALERDGFRYYRRVEGSILDLAAHSAMLTLRAVGDQRTGAVVYTSDTFVSGSPSKELRSILMGAGLDAIDGTVVGGRECDNLWVAVVTAEARLRSGMDDGAGVLLVTADKVTRGTRFNQDSRSVMSDGAASCFLSWHATGPAVAVRAAASLSVSPPAGATPLLRARHHVSALRELSSTVFEAAGMDAEECTTIITSNVGLSVAYMLRSAVGLPDVPLYRPGAIDVGHCFAADGIHSLGLLLEEPSTSVGDTVLVAATSPYSCSLLLLEVVSTGDLGILRLNASE